MPSFNLMRHLSSCKNKDNDHEKTDLPKSSHPTSNLSPYATSSTPTRRPANPPTVNNSFSLPSTSAGLPPAYTAADPAVEDPLSFLSTFDTVFLIDDSYSMTISHPRGTPTRWAQVSKTLADIAPTCTRYDSDGVDVHFLNHPDQPQFMNITSESAVNRIFNTFQPTGQTPTGRRLREILHPYLETCRRNSRAGKAPPKPLNLIVITDGAASDDPESVLAHIGKSLDSIEALPWQIGVQFCQVGDEKEAGEMLAFLDDELGRVYGCRDFVDTQRFDGGELGKEKVMKTVLGAVNKRWDRKMVG